LGLHPWFPPANVLWDAFNPLLCQEFMQTPSSYVHWRTYRFIFITALCGMAGFAVHAQAAGSIRLDPMPTLQASQPDTSVPAVAYRSVFADLPQGVEDTVVDWKAANAAVGQFKRGHADLLKWERDQARQPKPAGAGAQP
jgi:hypothetical protein